MEPLDVPNDGHELCDTGESALSPRRRLNFPSNESMVKVRWRLGMNAGTAPPDDAGVLTVLVDDFEQSHTQSHDNGGISFAFRTAST